LGFETAFAWISNELNNLPLCLGSKYRDLDSLDLITPNRLIHGRANKRAMSGPCTVDKPSKMLEKMGEVFEAWWRAWYNEKLADYVARPPKWLRSDPSLKEGDVVIFQKSGSEQVLGSPIWTIGRVVMVDTSQVDGQVRDVAVQYKNAGEKKFRTTHRAARSVAVLHREEDLDLMQELNTAAREAEKSVLVEELYKDQQDAVAREVEKCGNCAAPYLCEAHSAFFIRRPFVYPQAYYTEWSSGESKEPDQYDVYQLSVSVLSADCSYGEEPGAVCEKLRIHTDPWA